MTANPPEVATLIPTQEDREAVRCPFCGVKVLTFAPKDPLWAQHPKGDCILAGAKHIIYQWQRRPEPSQPPALDEQGAQEILAAHRTPGEIDLLADDVPALELQDDAIRAILTASCVYRGGDVLAMREAAAKVALRFADHAREQWGERSREQRREQAHREICAREIAGAIRALPASPLHASAPVEERAREVYEYGFKDGFVTAHVDEGGFPDEEAVLRNLDGVTIHEGWDAAKDHLLALTAALALPDGVREAVEAIDWLLDDHEKGLRLNVRSLSKEAVDRFKRVRAALSPVRDEAGGR